MRFDAIQDSARVGYEKPFAKVVLPPDAGQKTHDEGTPAPAFVLGLSAFV
jgi:hypothetical protein